MNIRIRQIKKARRMIETGMAKTFVSQVKEKVEPQFETCFTTVVNAFLDLVRAVDCASMAIANLVPNIYI